MPPAAAPAIVDFDRVSLTKDSIKQAFLDKWREMNDVVHDVVHRAHAALAAQAVKVARHTVGNVDRCNGNRLRAQSNCGVFTAGKWAIVSLIALPSCRSSLRNESVNPRAAALAAQ